MSALYRLEDAGIQVVTALASKYQELTTAARISLDKVSQTEYNHSSPEECAEVVIRQWLLGGSPSLSPTWRSLYKVLGDLDLGDVCQQIVEYLTSKWMCQCYQSFIRLSLQE